MVPWFQPPAKTTTVSTEAAPLEETPAAPAPRQVSPQVSAVLVWSKYSGGMAVIVLQKPSKTLLAANRRQHRGPSFVLLGGEQQEVVLSLMVPLRMVMCRELLESSPERAFSKQNQL